MDDLISRKQTLDALGLSEKTRKYGGNHSGYNTMMLYEIQDVIEGLHSVNPQANNEDIHREREQAYMKGYEDASKRYRTEPCEDVISRQALKDLGAECIAKRDENGNLIPLGSIDSLPSVSTEKTGRWIFVDKAKEHAHCSECDYGNVDLFDGRPHNYCPNCGARNEVEE